MKPVYYLPLVSVAVLYACSAVCHGQDATSQDATSQDATSQDATSQDATSQAAGGAGYLNQSATSWLTQAESTSGEQRRQAYYALGRIQPSTANIAAALAAGLEDGEVVGRRYAMASLSRTGALTAPHVKAISTAVEGKQVDDEFIRLHGINALAAAGAAARPYIPLLQQQLTAGQPPVRVAAALALWKIQQQPAAMAALTRFSKEDAAQAPFEATVALAGIGHRHQAVLPALIAALGHEDADVRRAAASGIGQYDIQALGPLADAINASAKFNNGVAAIAAGSIFDNVRSNQLHAPAEPLDSFKKTAGSLISGAAPAMVKLLSQPGLTSSERRLVAFQIAKLGEVAAFPLLKLASTPDADIRAAAIAGLERLERYLTAQPLPNTAWAKQQLVKPLILLLSNPAAELRLTASRLFAALKIGEPGRDAMPALRRILRQPADTKAHPYAARALAAMRGAGQQG